MKHDALLYLWDRRSLFIGNLDAPLKLCQGAACLIVGLEQPFRFRLQGSEEFIEVQSVLTPAGCDTEVDTGGHTVANLMLDPFGEDYALLSSVFDQGEQQASGVYINSPLTGVYQDALMTIYQCSPDYESAYQVLDKAIQQKASLAHLNHSIDPRVIAVVEELKNRVHENLSIEDLAALVNVSVSRLIQLFKQQTGIPIRRYRCWHRLFVASVMMAKTGNLTDAAVIAGFTDASHFTKTFHAMVGMNPSLLLSGPRRVRLFVE